jgi:hypothetical protein
MRSRMVLATLAVITAAQASVAAARTPSDQQMKGALSGGALAGGRAVSSISNNALV